MISINEQKRIIYFSALKSKKVYRVTQRKWSWKACQLWRSWWRLVALKNFKNVAICTANFEGAKKFFWSYVQNTSIRYQIAAHELLLAFNNISVQNRPQQYLQRLMLKSTMEKRLVTSTLDLRLSRILFQDAYVKLTSAKKRKRRSENIFTTLFLASYWVRSHSRNTMRQSLLEAFSNFCTALDAAWLQTQKQAKGVTEKSFRATDVFQNCKECVERQDGKHFLPVLILLIHTFPDKTLAIKVNTQILVATTAKTFNGENTAHMNW